MMGEQVGGNLANGNMQTLGRIGVYMVGGTAVGAAMGHGPESGWAEAEDLLGLAAWGSAGKGAGVADDDPNVRSLDRETDSGSASDSGDKAGDVTKTDDTSTGTGKYGHLKDPDDVSPGKDFTAEQKQAIVEENKRLNGGEVKSDLSGQVLTKPIKSMKGVTPDPNEWQIDHIHPRSRGGTNSYSNAQVLSRAENRAKWDQ